MRPRFIRKWGRRGNSSSISKTAASDAYLPRLKRTLIRKRSSDVDDIPGTSSVAKQDSIVDASAVADEHMRNEEEEKEEEVEEGVSDFGVIEELKNDLK